MILRSTIQLAHGLGMRVVVEGVEDHQVAARLAELECDCIQGWVTGKPMPASSLPFFLAESGVYGRPQGSMPRTPLPPLPSAFRANAAVPETTPGASIPLQPYGA
jgi:predicted signal transduction protein with EAL and GGDEF domain